MTFVSLGLLANHYWPSGDGSLRRVQRTGKLVIAIDSNYAPMEFEKDGQLTGFDHDLAQEVAKRLDVQAEFKRVNWEWSNVPKALKDRQCDMAISAWTITPERKREVAFVPYLVSNSVYVCRRGLSVKDERDLAGKIVVVNGGTEQHKFLLNLQKKGTTFKDLIVLEAGKEPIPLLKEGKAEVTVIDEPVGKYHAKLDPNLEVTGSIGQAMNPPPLGMVVHLKDEQLRQAIESAFQAMNDDGKFTRI